MSVSSDPAPQRRPRGFVRSIPVIGRVIHDLETGGPDTIYYLLVTLLTLVVLAVKSWGIVALTMIALAMVPIVVVVLVMLTLGR